MGESASKVEEKNTGAAVDAGASGAETEDGEQVLEPTTDVAESPSLADATTTQNAILSTNSIAIQAI